MDKFRINNNIFMEKIDKQENAILNINNELLRFIEIEKNIKENTFKIEENTNLVEEYQFYNNKKFTDMDKNYLNIMENFREINRQNELKIMGAGSLITNSIPVTIEKLPDTNNVQILGEVFKTNREVENIRKTLREFNEKLEKINKTNINFDDQIKTIYLNLENHEKEIKSFTENDNTNQENIKKTEYYKDSESLKGNIEMLYDKLTKITEGIKTFSVSLNLKITKEDFDKFSRYVNQETEKLHIKIKELNKLTDNKIKNILQFEGNLENKKLNLEIPNNKIWKDLDKFKNLGD